MRCCNDIGRLREWEKLISLIPARHHSRQALEAPAKLGQPVEGSRREDSLGVATFAQNERVTKQELRDISRAAASSSHRVSKQIRRLRASGLTYGINPRIAVQPNRNPQMEKPLSR